MVSGNYGVFWRNDGSSTYLLMTASGDQYGNWNTLRPFYVSDSTGAVHMNNGVTIASGLTVSSGISASSGGICSYNSGSTTCGGSTAGYMYADAFYYNSDERLKKDITPITGMSTLEKVNKLQGVTFRWKNNTENNVTQLGFIAQNVEKVFPEAVETGSNETGGYKTVNYAALLAPTVEAVKENYNITLELQGKLEEQKNRIDDQQEKIKELSEENENQKKGLKEQEDRIAGQQAEIMSLKQEIQQIKVMVRK